MPTSPSKLTTLRPDLKTVVEFDLEMQRRNYIGLQLMPRFDVPRRSGTFGKIPIEQLLAATGEKLERAARSGFSRRDWTFTEDSFATKSRGVEEPVDDDESEIYRDYFDAELVAAMRAYDRLFGGYERRIVAQAIDATETASQTTAAGTVWSTSASATPRANVKAAGKAIWDRTGYWPNVVAIGRLAYRDLQDCDEIIDRMAGQGSGVSSLPREVTLQRLAEIFDVERVVVADAIQLSSGGTVSQIFPATKALVMRAATGPDFSEPCFGRTLVYTGVSGDFDPTPETYRDEPVKSDIVRMQHESQEKVLYSEMAQVITGIAS